MRFPIAILVASVLFAQSPADQQKPTFRAGVNYVRVDAYPTAKGRPVTDLLKDDFEILEDGVPQTVDAFEHVVIRAAPGTALRAEPATVRESNEAAANPRSRLFVVFIDTYHISNIWTGYALVDVAPTRRALTGFLQRLLGEDDLVALMTPDMPADAVTFTRRPASIEEFLGTQAWQRMGDELDLDPREQMWDLCYPPDGPGRHSVTVVEMMARSREQRVLQALRRLVSRLQALREERKAILIVSEGWVLYRPNSALSAPKPGERIPGPPPIGVGVDGKLRIGRDDRELVSRRECDSDRLMLAALDNAREFRTLTDLANRANATFYPISPAGLRAAGFNTREESLRNLAAATDGVAAVGTNDPAPVLARIAEDTSSYYLLGYSSTNAKFDGRFRKLTVRVKRPGVSVRARRGYLAPTEDEVTARAAVVARPADPEVARLQSALGLLDRARPDRVIHVQTALVPSAAGGSGPSSVGSVRSPAAPGPAGQGQRAIIYLVVELDATTARKASLPDATTLSATLQDDAGRTVSTRAGSVSPASRTSVFRFDDAPVAGGAYMVRVTAQSAGQPATEMVRVTVPPEGATLGQAIVFRRGPFTGPAFQATSDLRFRKAERLRADVGVVSTPDSVTARLLDRRGQMLAVPVTVGEREENGVRFATAEASLAPLAPGDYLLEIVARFGGREAKTLFAFRIVP
jgi:VWFA-related protein